VSKRNPIDSLSTIQRLQFTDREKAERLLQRWFARHMHLSTESVTLTPKAVSLNSFNGFYRSDGEEYFFKTHVEEQGVLEEYYHTELLDQAGYNVVKPLRTLHEEGRQMVIYPVVRWPVMFDLVRALETDHRNPMVNPFERPVMFDLVRALEMDNEDEDAINRVPTSTEELASAEREECKRLLDIYQATLALSTAEEHAHAPIHQLFWHRLAGERFKSFYEGKHVPFPGEHRADIPFNALLTYRWVINGAEQQHTLGELVERAKVVLHPARTAMTIIGHGDAHFGNVFLENQRSYLYFDPAFAGRHTPLLDVIKPLFHNVFATWMYFPHDIARHLHIAVSVHETAIILEHNYTLTPVRQAILQAKIQYLLIPLIEKLRSQNALAAGWIDWIELMRLALMCCPLLTINLLDSARIPAAISWLGLSQAVQLGNTGVHSWRADL